MTSRESGDVHSGLAHLPDRDAERPQRGAAQSPTRILGRQTPQVSSPAPGPAVTEALDTDLTPRDRRSRREGGGARIGGALLVGFVAVVLAAPIVFMVVQSFNLSGLGAEFTPGLDPWREMLGSERTREALAYTFGLALRVVPAVVIGGAIAWFLARTRIRGKRWVEYSLWLSFFLPTVPVVLGWVVLADPHTGLLNEWLRDVPGAPTFDIYSFTGIFWVHITLSTVPVMAIFIAPALRQMDTTLEEAAVMAGASTFYTLRRISGPLIKTAVLAATVIGFIRSLEVFEVEEILGTPAGIDVYATRIFDQVGSNPPLYAQAMALGVVMLVTLVVLAVINQVMTRRWGDIATIGGRGTRSRSVRSRGRDRFILGLIITGLLVSLYVPLAVVLLGSFRWRFGFFTRGSWTTEHWTRVATDSAITEALRTSLFVAFLVGVLGLTLYALFAWVIARRRLAYSRVLALVCWLPWAVPGLLLGFAWMSLILGTGIGGAVYGTLIPLVVVLVIKELPLGVSMLRGAMTQISPELEESAVMSGANQRVVLGRVLLPLMVPMLATVFVFTFMMSMRDIAATIMLATPGTRTLALLLFEYAVEGSYESSAIIGLVMAALASVVAILALRVMEKHSLGGL